MKQEDAQQLIEYGRWLLAQSCGQATGGPPPWTASFVRLLGAAGAASPPESLQSILTLIEAGDRKVPPAYTPPVPLDLNETPDGAWTLFPRAAPAGAPDDRRKLYLSFREAGGDQETGFDRFFYLMRKYATTLPNTYGEPGVSLFEQWKMVAALVGISGSLHHPPDALGLVGGDIPGIQRVINTVTAKGAAKAMRGRSAFIQLLGHALVRRLLDALDLGPANVVYDAGGNFVLLTGWSDAVAARVTALANEINRVLLVGAGEDPVRFDGFHGDLSVALAAVPLTEGIDALRWDLPPLDAPGGAKVSRWQQAEKRLKDSIAAAKARPFGDLAQEGRGFADLFGPEASETDEFCAVCRRQRRAGEPAFKMLDPEAAAALGSNDVCPECRGFNELADDLGHGDRHLVLSNEELDPSRTVAWQRGLHAIAGRWYTLLEVGRLGQVAGRGYEVLALDPQAFPEPGVTGFRWFAHTTPLGEDGRIKPNDVLAAESQGIVRLGVLRMDVDNLGDLIVHGLPIRTPMQTAELSQALERFFAGWLDRICTRTGTRAGEDRRLFYVLFAGGDDLFVLGPWNLMPELAIAIRDDFHRYCGEHPAIHLSAGIAVVGEHEPLYRAADESHDALSDAKKLDRDGAKAKNAVTFLGHTLHWDEFASAVSLKDDIIVLAEDDGLSNAVITRLLAIERRYRRDRQRGRYGARGKTPQGGNAVYYGPWMWQQTYALARLGRERHEDVQHRLVALQKRLVEGAQITQLGLAARWAQWLIRRRSQHGK